MQAFRQQRTIRRPVAVEGFGYFSGRDVRVEFRPSAAGAGVVFVREDLSPAVRIAARVENRVDSPRRTTLSRDGARVEMVEHVLAALAGLEIDNCLVAVDAAEMPGLDGSSLAFVEALDAAGAETLDVPRARLRVTQTVRVGDENAWAEARVAPGGGLSVKYHLDYGDDNAIGRQTLQLRITPETFRRELAACRTFLSLEEAQWLRSRGLGVRATSQDLLVFGPDGPIDNTLRFPDECVRHKALDVVGDLALAGCDLDGLVVAHKSGHRHNAELVGALLAAAESQSAWRRSA